MTENTNSNRQSGLQEDKVPDSIKLIFLIGMPAAGKTYWGRKLAEARNWNFTDLDEYISMQEKASIPALFASYGENGFREREHKYLLKLINAGKSFTVIACGGGTPLFFKNIDLMKKNGIVFYLKADIDTLIQRLQNSPEVRPLLKGRGNLPVYLKKLQEERDTVYEQAHYILDTKSISLTTFEEILR